MHHKNIVNSRNHIIISINEDSSYSCIPSDTYCKGILRLVFDDIDENTYGTHSYSETLKKYKEKLFTRVQAREILDFVDAHKDEVNLIIVHCHAGISRSAGTAAALSYILNGTDDAVVRIRPCFNRFVYRTILNEYYGA
jgi:predicted protein tyrosine phosphatase